MEEITLNQLIKRLFVYRAENPQSGRKTIRIGETLTGVVTETNDGQLKLN